MQMTRCRQANNNVVINFIVDITIIMNTTAVRIMLGEITRAKDRQFTRCAVYVIGSGNYLNIRHKQHRA